THPRLTRVSVEMARQEIAASRAELEDSLGVEVSSFAYPKGDHNAVVRSLVAECGYRCAATVREGLVHADAHMLALPRISARPAESMLVFGCKAHPGIDLYERLVGRA
ncbi:MAG TPA: polysaccharide deacetylase family protein, partial [Actinomycetota bacterium]|nr:polysaccharide deacetylase family protein [Actinomycetota bacterium]